MDTVEVVRASQDGNHLEKLLKKLQGDMGFENANFGIFNPWTSHAVAYSTYPKEWQEHYIGNGYQQIDPANIVSLRSTSPQDWSRLRDMNGYAEVFSAAADFGVPNQGLTIPIRGYLGEFGMLSVCGSMSNREWKSLTADRIIGLQQQAANLVDRLSSSITPISEYLKPQLSQLEKDVLKYVSAGVDIIEISGRMNISMSMVELCLKSARTKLRAVSTPQAIGRAMQQGIISPL
jgi:DNA-binding CsgD family transcriptional regulator